jgi:hypothetical protein
MDNDNNNRDDNAPHQSQAFLDRLLEEGIKPHAMTIAIASAAGEVSVVFYDVASEFPVSVAAARALGWRGGRSECIPLNRTHAERIADKLPSAVPSAKWLRGRRPGRIFVCTGGGSLCVNYEPGVGFSLEPGTTNREWMS